MVLVSVHLLTIYQTLLFLRHARIFQSRPPTSLP